MFRKQDTKILIADDDSNFTRYIANYFEEKGFECQVSKTTDEAAQVIRTWRPRFVLANLMLPEGSGLSLVKTIKAHQDSQRTGLVIMSAHNDKKNVAYALKQGAIDYIVKPIQCELLLERVIFHCRRFKQVRRSQNTDLSKINDASYWLYLLDIVTKVALVNSSLHEALFQITSLLAKKMQSSRCNVIQYISATEGKVVASSDSKLATGIPLDLMKYPEVLKVISSGEPLYIKDLDSNQVLQSIKDQLSSINFSSMIVCPIIINTETFGVLSVRMKADRSEIFDHEIRFVEICAQIIGLLLKHKTDDELLGLVDSLMETTKSA